MRTPFGTLPDGTLIEEFHLAADGIEARVITWGAVLRDLLVRDREGRMRRVVLGLHTLDDYVQHSRNFGAICGRVANRIGHARFTLHGVEHRLTQNLRGGHILHGGDGAFGRRPWRVLDATPASVTLEVTSPAGEDGFPGTVTARCTYSLIAPGTLSVLLEAETDAPTPVNLAHHTYWNLGAPDITAHTLQVAADFFTPSDGEGIPTGEIRSVAGTPYDFRTPRALGGAGAARPGYDINLVLAGTPAATLQSPSGDLALTIATTAPGLQLFDAHTISTPVPGLHGVAYGPRCGVALEPQFFPDSVNSPHFPGTILRPGQRFHQETAFRIS